MDQTGEKASILISRNKLIVAISGFLLGVFVASFVSFSLTLSLFFVFISGCIFVYALFVREIPIRSVIVSFAIFFALFSLGFIRYGIHNQTSSDPSFVAKIGQTVSMVGVVLDEPLNKDTYEQYIISAPGGEEKLMVKGGLYPKFKYGDEVKFEGKLQEPSNFETDNGKTFDYVSYLRKDNIHYILSFAHGTLVSSGHGNVVVNFLITLKQKFVGNLQELIPEPESSLLSGVLLGIQDSLGKDLTQVFRDTGIIHIVVLSGYNITIVSESIVKVFSFLPKSFALGSGAFGIILFSLMVGGTPSVLRASVMALLVLLARSTGRTYDIGRALLLAAFFMVLWNPNVLVFDTSFQLSFLSTVALIWISPIFEKYFSKIPETFGLRGVFSATLSTQLFVLPLLLFKMGQVSLVGLPVNLLVLGVIPTIMFLGFIAGLLSFGSGVIAFPVALITQFLLAYVIKTAELFASLPFAAVQISYFPALFFWLMYAVYGFIFWKIHKNISNKNLSSKV
jgi:competence protein ComEC